ncbi:MAG: hypothetical protein Q9213_004514 [Squamulea squamosa]
MVPELEALRPRAWKPDPGFTIGNRAPYVDPFPYGIPGTSQTIIFSRWGDELPNHDDVISLLDNAEHDIEREIEYRGWDEPMAKIQGWNFQTARLVITNDEEEDGVTHKQLLSFLNGLRLFGQQFGFWKCDMELYDSRFSAFTRGYGRLGWAQPPREAIAAEA